MRHYLKVAVTGKKEIGKSDLLLRLQGKECSSKYKWTIGVDFCTVNTSDFSYQFWEFGGDARFTEVTDNHFKLCSIVLLCFDKADIQSFSYLEARMQAVLKQEPEAVFVLVATKEDQPSSQKNITALQIKEFQQKHHIKEYIETSAHKSTNLLELVATLEKLSRELIAPKSKEVKAKASVDAPAPAKPQALLQKGIQKAPFQFVLSFIDYVINSPYAVRC